MSGHTTRRAFAAMVAAVGLAGCSEGQGGETSTGRETSTQTPTTQSENPAVGNVEQMGELQLTSPAFEDGEPIPEKYGRGGEDVNPPLSIAGVPEAVASMVLLMDDPDAVEPAGEVWLHWLVWNVPPSTTEIPERWEPTDAVEGTNDFDEEGYGGPAPPDSEHTYRFKLYALNTTLDLAESASKREVGEAMAGDLLAQTQLTGTFAP